MIIVTGGAGFIGSNLVRALNISGRKDLVVVDDLSDGHKFQNMADCSISDYFDKDEFAQIIESGKRKFDKIDAVFHLGACSDTTEWDGRMMLDNNYRYSKEVLHFCMQNKIPLIYASSAAVYGVGDTFTESSECENPINVYAYSKLLFDNYVRRVMGKAESQIVGLRYFNVYGRGEAHKGEMASVAYQFNKQILENSKVKLFEGISGYSDGEQLRDFIYVDDVVAISRWFMSAPQVSGIFNVGTGDPHTFNDMAKTVIDWHGHGEIEYISFPEKLRNNYQSFTKANLARLRSIGCDYKCNSLESGMKEYLGWLNKTGA